MKEKKKKCKNKSLTLLGIFDFCLVNVFIFDNKMGAGFSASSTITLMSIDSCLSAPVCEWLVILLIFINVVAAVFGFNYVVGFLNSSSGH